MGPARIVFTSNRDGSAQIYLMNTDGTNQTRLTNNQTNDEFPRWSPNNSRIVFQSDRDHPFSGAFDIYAMNADGSSQTRLTGDANDDSVPVWSPDGSRIAFQGARNGANYQVYVMNADGSNQVNINNDAFNDTQPSWSPDGSRIAFASDRDHSGANSIYVMNSNGTNQTRLTFSAATFTDEQPAWSPDGSRLAFTSTRDSTVVTWTETDDDGGVITKSALRVNKEAYVMNADGSNQVRLTNTLENDDSPAWSSDGLKIVFRSDRERDCCDPTAQVWIMNVDGSNQADLSNNGWGDSAPNWSGLGLQASSPSPVNSNGLMWSTAMLPVDFSSGFGGSGVVASPPSLAQGFGAEMVTTHSISPNPRESSAIATSGDWTIQWVVTDQLGTPRITVDQTGDFSGVTRHDYLPFGEELTTQGVRTPQLGYNGDSVRQKFTQKERDIETGLDYFKARYYSSTQGRFTSVDPSRQSVRLDQPQSWNRYTYALNNPLAYVDENGKWPTWIHELIIDNALRGLSAEMRSFIKAGSYSVDDPLTGGQNVENSNQHGMTKPGQSREDAAEKADQFINENVDAAQRHGISTFDRYSDFGRALHAVQDMTSPVHEGYQVWNGGLLHPATDRQHIGGESAISNFRMGLAVGATLALYRYTFGQTALQRATGYTPGSENDPTLKDIRAQYSLPGSHNEAAEGEAVYEYRLGLQEGLNFDWGRQRGRRGRRERDPQ